MERRYRAALWTIAWAFLLAWRSPAMRGDDWPQFRGPGRDGVSREGDWLAQWPAGGPAVLWKGAVGSGRAGLAIARGRLFAIGSTREPEGASSQEEFDNVWCLDAETGRVVWRHKYPCESSYYYGPFTTPTVDGSFVYTLSKFGLLCCLETETGRLVWTRHLVDDLRGQKPYYGYACCPLVIDGLVVVIAGGKEGPLVALNQKTGDVVWRHGQGSRPETGYSTPIAASIAGKNCVVALTPTAVSAVEPQSGREVWSHPWNSSANSSCASPVVAGEFLFVSASETKQTGMLLKVSGGTTSVVWEGKQMMNYFNACVVHAGCLYGIHSLDHVSRNSTLRCVELVTGQVHWDYGGVGLGALILADNKLLLLTEKGELILAEASPKSYRELARAKVLDGTCWSAPVLSGGRVFCRSHRGEIVCLDVKAPQ